MVQGEQAHVAIILVGRLFHVVRNSPDWKYAACFVSLVDTFRASYLPPLQDVFPSIPNPIPAIAPRYIISH